MLEVTHGQAARLRDEAEYPFKAAALHPSWSPAFGAGDIVEGSSDGKHHGVNPSQMVHNPVLLLWATEADKEQARLGRSNTVNDGQVFFRGKRPERRAFSISHVEIRMPETNGGGQSIESNLASAVEANRHACLFGRCQHERRKVRAADPLGTALSKRMERPYQRHSVGEDRAGAIQLAKECRLVNGFHDHVDGGEEECARLPLPGPDKTLFNRLIVAADSNIDPENRPGDKGIQRLGGRHHGWILLVKLYAPLEMAAPDADAPSGGSSAFRRP